MRVRELKPGDEDKLRQLHEQSGFEYPFPDFKEFLPVAVIADENDTPVIAVGAVPTAEIYMFMDPNWETPGMREQGLKLIHEHVRKQLLSYGFVQVHAFPPPQISGKFKRRLLKLGWFNVDWPCFSRRLDHG